MTEQVSLVEVLGKHLWHHTRDTHCSCGFRTPLAQLALQGYLAHLASVIEGEYVVERVAQAHADVIAHVHALTGSESDWLLSLLADRFIRDGKDEG